MSNVSPEEQSALITAIAEVHGYQFGRFTTAAGLEANFKIELAEAVERDSSLMNRFAGYVAIELANVDAIAAVGGALSLAREVSANTGLPLIELRRRRELGGIIATANAGADDILNRGPSISVVEDVSSTRSTVEKAIRTLNHRGSVEQVITGWRRGVLPPMGMSEKEVLEFNRTFAFKELYEFPSNTPIIPIIERKLPLWIPLQKQILNYLPELEGYEWEENEDRGI